MVGNLDEWVADWDERSDLLGPFYFHFCVGGSDAGAACTSDKDCTGGKCDTLDEAKVGRAGTKLCSLCSRGSNDGIACTTPAHCPGGACTHVGRVCATDKDCPDATCGFIHPPGEPAAFQRGGSYATGTGSGVFTLSVGGGAHLWSQHPYFGFRCARWRG